MAGAGVGVIVRAYLVRHGEAKSADVDPDRRLTERGADDVRRIATAAVAANDLGVRPAHIFHSDKARARQTAEIWAAVTGATTREMRGLAPNDDPAVWATRLRTEDDGVMLVGHLPHLERLVALLVNGDPDQMVVGFPAGGLVVLDGDDGGDDGGSGWMVRATRP